MDTDPDPAPDRQALDANLDPAKDADPTGSGSTVLKGQLR
jgi:hypothetical protein